MSCGPGHAPQTGARCAVQPEKGITMAKKTIEDVLSEAESAACNTLWDAGELLIPLVRNPDLSDDVRCTVLAITGALNDLADAILGSESKAPDGATLH